VRVSRWLAAASVIAVLVGCGQAATPTTGGRISVTLRLGTPSPDDNQQTIAAHEFADLVNKATDGQVTVQIFSNSVLGTEQQMIQQMQQGALDMGAFSAALTEAVEPSVGVFNLPYVLSDYTTGNAVLNGPAGAKVSANLLKDGIRNLGYWDLGIRDTICRNAPITELSSFKGVKIRVPQSAVFIDTFKYLGATPVPLAFNELYTALQTGAVQCAEGNPNTFVNAKFNEVAKFYSETHHGFGVSFLFINDSKFKTLPSAIQQDIITAADTATKHEQASSAALDQTGLDKLQSLGVKVNTLDLAPLKTAVQPMYDAFGIKIGDPALVQSILNGG
jgi:TRAP-type transport system periplasmic protein